MNNYLEHKILSTTQNNIVIPTGDLIKNKKVDLRVVACISALSNVGDCSQVGDNIRYTPIKKVNKHLDKICEILMIDKPKLFKRIRYIASLESQEFCKKTKLINGESVPCIEINYTKGGFVTLEYADMEFLTSSLSANAFKLYLNLLWLCVDRETNKYIERQLTQEFLLGLIGLSKTSKRILKKAEDELVVMNLIRVRTKWERELSKNLLTSTPITKKYYKIIDA